MAGKSRLKKSATSSSSIEDEVGQVAKLPPAPVPPPPPPPPAGYSGPSSLIMASSKPLSQMKSYEIPQAPKLHTKVPAPKIASKKGLVAPNGISAREELMSAIRGTGGFQGLRKVNKVIRIDFTSFFFQ